MNPICTPAMPRHSRAFLRATSYIGLAALFFNASGFAQDAMTVASAAPATSARTFMDYFLPTPAQGALSKDAWGAVNVQPRDVKNGLEDIANKYCYWDGQIIKGPDGRYHMFASRWDESRGHNGWKDSLAVHAVSDNLLGPYVDKGLCWPENQGGKGHNVTALQLPDGRYAIVVSETRQGDVFVSQSLDGPWEHLGSIVTEGDVRKRASNYSVMVRPDGDFQIVPRSGQIMISKTGILGPYKAQGPSIYPGIAGLEQRNLEDPVIWFSGGLYHIVVNSWSQRKAFHLTSADGITGWTLRGLAYDPRRDFVRHTDGTVNRWDKLERPGVVLENGHVVAVTLAVLDVPKEEEKGNDNHGSKVIVIPFDGAALDRDLENASATAAAEIPAGGNPDRVLAPGPFAPDPVSLAAHYEPPEWFRDAKFGIWAHWSAQCVPEDGDWYARNMYLQGQRNYDHHLKIYGHPADTGFMEIENLWKAQNWDPEKLMDLYVRAGAKYFVALANHHDNFDAYDSTHHAWNSVNVGPKRDIVGIWAKAARARGLRFGASNHSAHAWHWFQPAYAYDAGGPRSGERYDAFKLRKEDGKGKWWEGLDPQELYTGPNMVIPDGFTTVAERNKWHENNDRKWTEKPPPMNPAFTDKWFLRAQELVDKYRPDLVYFDNTGLPLGQAGLDFAAHYYNASLQWHGGRHEAVLTVKGNESRFQGAVTADIERGVATGILDQPWQTDTCIGDWHYNRRTYENNRYKTAPQVIRMLCDIVSKNGNLLLSIPMRGDGAIDDKEVAFLEEMGRWMAINGEAIYGTRPWAVYGEGPSVTETGEAGHFGGLRDVRSKPYTASDIRFTRKGDALYAIIMERPGPGDRSVLITSLATDSPHMKGLVITSVELPGQDGALEWSRDASGVRVSLPEKLPGEHAFPLKITLARAPASAASQKNADAEAKKSPARRVTISEPALPVPPGPFAPDWESIRAHYKPPAWLVDGKFGIFIHWGVYTVPAHQSEWYARHMYASSGVIKWHRENFGPQDVFGYKDFIPLFKAGHYDPAAWADLFKRAGARYVMPVAEHHDGFAMYDSKLTRWNAKNMGPRRDLIGDLADAVRDAGLVFCLSNHRMEHWSFLHPADDLKTDLYDPDNADFYGPPQPSREIRAAKGEVIAGRDAEQSPAFLEEWLRRNQELVDKYKPQMVFFDNGVNARALDEVKLRFAAYYYNRAKDWNIDASITTKRDAYLAGSVKDYERGRPVDIAPEFWQCDTSITHNGWCYTDGIVLRNAGELIRELVDCVSKNGAYLLNIAPRSDGVIPNDQQLRLLQIGEWLRVNGEAIYGSRPWRRFGEGPTEEAPTRDRGIINAMLRTYTPGDMRFTTQRDSDGACTLYAHLFAWPDDSTVTITSLATGSPDAGEIKTVTLLGGNQRVTFERTAEGLVVKLPPWRPSDHVNVLKITGLK